MAPLFLIGVGACLLLGVEALEELRVGENGGQRRAQFMAGEREKFILEVVQSLHLLACLRLLSDLNGRNEQKIGVLWHLLASHWNETAIPDGFFSLPWKGDVDFPN